MRRPVVFALMALLAPTLPAAASDGASEGRTELTVFGGASLLQAEVESRGPLPLRSGVVSPMGGVVLPIPLPPELPSSLRFGQKTSLDGSVVFGFRLGHYVKRRAALELDFAVAPSHELRDELSWPCLPYFGCAPEAPDRFPVPVSRGSERVVAYHYGAGLAFDLASGEIRPALLLGAGGVTYDQLGGTRTDFVLRFGAGLKLYFGRVGARIEVVDHLVPDQFLTGRTEHDVHANAGFLVRWP